MLARMKPLLEREVFAAQLAAAYEALGQQASGGGKLLLLAGEAGIGKTSLLEQFAADLRRQPVQGPRAAGTVLWGGCEALLTPHPLGPLHDVARTGLGRLKSLLDDGSPRAVVFDHVLGQLSGAPRPLLMVLEDAHWADAATLDLIKFLGRRIQQTRALLVLSYRDDEVGAAHPLRVVLGELPPAHVLRLQLPRLSAQAVAQLARQAAGGVAAGGASGVDSVRLFEVTGGNPFFVTEVLAAHGHEAVPATLHDAVLARAARLGAAARQVLDVVALAPRSMELALLDAVLGAEAAAASDDCISAGLLTPLPGAQDGSSGDALRFRHELARVAIEDALAPARRRQLHARVLKVLGAPGSPWARQHARLVHHALLAGDQAAVLRLAPLAEHEATLRGARREAAAHCRAALAQAATLPPLQRAELLERYAQHCFELNDYAHAHLARSEAIALFEQAGAPAAQCAAQSALARLLVRMLRNAEADAACQQAMQLARTLPGHDNTELARAYATWAYLRMLNRDYQEAMDWGRQAIALAEPLPDKTILAAAWNAVGAAQMFVDYAGGVQAVQTSLGLARALPDGGAAVADAYVMLGTASGEVFQLQPAQAFLHEGLAFARARDLDRFANYMGAWQALIAVYQGDWDAAGASANALLAREPFGSTNRIMALVALGRLRTRRGDPGAQEVLDEALALAERTGTLQRIAPVRCIRAELAWLQGDSERAQREAQAAFALAQAKQHPWYAGEMAWWLWRCGALERVLPPHCAPVYADMLQGRWQDAARFWQQLNCPYERATALTLGDSEAQRQALQLFELLGARPAAQRLRDSMKEAGVPAIPRGPRASTRANPAGLTARELEILALLAGGLHNAQIAQRLSRSARTVDHHVAAIFAKLGADSRAEAARLAREQGLLP
jgi:DNA-binding CsgD family transcriptional regulator